MSEIFKNKTGYAVRFRYNGERPYKGGFRTKGEAEQWIEEYKKASDEKIRLAEESEKSLTIRQIMEIFYDNYVETNLAPSTQKRYRELIVNHILPILGEIKVIDLKPLEITNAYKILHTDPRFNLSYQTVKKDHNVLNKALNTALKWGIIDRNPCAAVEPPKPETVDMNVLSENELHELLSYLKGTALYIPVLIASSTGMRVGEVAGLQESDVDLDNKKIYVRHQLQYLNQEYRLTKTKTRRSSRPIALLDEIIPDLKAYELQKKEERLAMGSEYTRNSYYCRWPDGHNITNTYMTKALRREAKQLGFDIRFHDLRHTHATILFKHGVHPKIVAERLGHSKIQITMDTYTHFIPDMQTETLANISFSVFGQTENKLQLIGDELKGQNVVKK